MSNPAGKKGWIGEAPVVAWLEKKGFYRAYRMRSQGVHDKGDVGGIDDVAIEIKNQGTYTLATWMKETLREKTNAGAKLGALVIKPKGVGPANVENWWVMMTLEDFTQLMIDAGYGPREDTI